MNTKAKKDFGTRTLYSDKVFSSRYSKRLTAEEFHQSLINCFYEEHISVKTTNGTRERIHVYVTDHAYRRLKSRGEINCINLLVYWVEEFLRYPQAVDDVFRSEDFQSFTVLNRDLRRIIAFSVSHGKETIIIVRTVFFLAWNQYDKFFIGDRTSKVYSYGNDKVLISDIDKIDEMEFCSL